MSNRTDILTYHWSTGGGVFTDSVNQWQTKWKSPVSRATVTLAIWNGRFSKITWVRTRVLFYDDNVVYRLSNSFKSGSSIRCIKD